MCFLLKKAVHKRINSNKKLKKAAFYWKRYFLIAVVFIGISVTFYHYKHTLLYYFSFKKHQNNENDRLNQARIAQIIKTHSKKPFGIDVSQYQGKINWNEVKMIDQQVIRFVFVRATIGNDGLDTRFKENWNAAQQQKFTCGAYHYYRPNENSILQAKLFVKNVRLHKGDFPPILDIEKLPEEQSIDSLKVGLKRWLQFVENHYKVKPIIYSSEGYYSDFLKSDFENYTFWVANYNFFVNDFQSNWLFWQFTDKGFIDGIDEKVDINIFNGTPEMLEKLRI